LSIKILGIITGLILSLIIALDSFSAELFLAIIIGCALTRKIDNQTFMIIGVIAIMAPLALVLSHHYTEILHIRLTILVLLTIVVILDEIIDYVGHQKNIQILRYRPMLWIIMCFFVFLHLFTIKYLIAVVVFDVCYIIVGKYH